MATARLFGSSIKRREDPRFITGKGNYVADIKRPDMAMGVFLRSPHAHALIESIDIKAAAASMLARCADKDKFFPLIETLFQMQRTWAVEKPIPPLLAIAKQAGFTEQSFNECLANQQILDGLKETQNRAAQKFNVNSTPTFFINGKMFRGTLTPEELDKQVAPYLKG